MPVRFIAAAMLVAAMLATLSLVACGGGNKTSNASTGVYALFVGDCIASHRAGTTSAAGLVDAAALERVACDSGLATGRVLTTYELDLKAYPGADVLEEDAIKKCALERAPSYLFPTETSWKAGDHTLACIHESRVPLFLVDCVGGMPRGVVSCDSAEVVGLVQSIVDLSPTQGADAPYPGEASLETRASDACGDLLYLLPSASSWEDGDRQVACLAPLE